MLFEQSVMLMPPRPHFESLRVGRTKGEIETISQELLQFTSCDEIGCFRRRHTKFQDRRRDWIALRAEVTGKLRFAVSLSSLISSSFFLRVRKCHVTVSHNKISEMNLYESQIPND